MQRGGVVEAGDARAVLAAPQHPYSRLLKDAVLSVDHPGAGLQPGTSNGDDASLPA
jgi:peptide/nickel transport system ATP-binding protein